jgi:amidophosphoribosyltransferase
MACGFFGAYSIKKENVFPYIYWGIRAQNNRGQQSYGFSTLDGFDYIQKKGLDEVPKLNHKQFDSWSSKLKGSMGIASVRYTTFGPRDEISQKMGAQPVTLGDFSAAFNGQILPSQYLIDKTKISNPMCDLRYIVKDIIINSKNKDTVDAVEECMKDIEGAYSVVCMRKNGEFFTFRDPHGIRPLCYGHDENKGLLASSSETVGLDINEIHWNDNFEVKPGEIMFFNKRGIESQQLVHTKRKALCAFEFAYFARPDSRLAEETPKHVYQIREEFGRNLVNQYPDVVKDADIIISIPETSDDVAYGVHEATGLRWERNTRRHRYVTERAFMGLKDERQNIINKKINIIPKMVDGKKIIVTEDSIVRGDTTRIFVDKLRSFGAKKVYFFVSYPRVIGPCLYGIDIPTYSELIGSSKDENEIAELIGADSVNYQSIENFSRAVGMPRDHLCLGCVTCKYPTHGVQKIADEKRKEFESSLED